jgi:hypothetical protein
MGEFSSFLKFQIVFFCVIPYASYWVLRGLRELLRGAHVSYRPVPR